MSVRGRVAVGLALTFALVAASAGCTTTTDGRATASVSVAPPAVSGLDEDVWVHIALADSFDIGSDGSCTGRDTNAGLRSGGPIWLRGLSTGVEDQAITGARFVHYPTRIYHGKPLLDDDYEYCVIDAVVTPTTPDPHGYALRYGAQKEMPLGTPGMTPFGLPEHPGYGKYQILMKSCPSLLDPPSKECPVLGN